MGPACILRIQPCVGQVGGCGCLDALLLARASLCAEVARVRSGLSCGRSWQPWSVLMATCESGQTAASLLAAQHASIAACYQRCIMLISGDVRMLCGGGGGRRPSG